MRRHRRMRGLESRLRSARWLHQHAGVVPLRRLPGGIRGRRPQLHRRGRVRARARHLLASGGVQQHGGRIPVRLLPPGYTGDGHTCTDVNECATNNGGCSPVTTCTNLPGSFSCGACLPWYTGDGYSCTDINECPGRRPRRATRWWRARTCRADSFVVRVRRDTPATGKTGCLDIDECALRARTPCNKTPRTTCSNTAGRLPVQSLPVGVCRRWTDPLRGHRRVRDQLGGCDSLVVCINTPGARLPRLSGRLSRWTGDALRRHGRVHGPHRRLRFARELHEHAGPFICACPSGFTGDGITGCLDIDDVPPAPTDAAATRPSPAATPRADTRVGPVHRATPATAARARTSTSARPTTAAATAGDLHQYAWRVRLWACPAGFIGGGHRVLRHQRVSGRQRWLRSADRLREHPGQPRLRSCPAGYSGTAPPGVSTSTNARSTRMVAAARRAGHLHEHAGVLSLRRLPVGVCRRRAPLHGRRRVSDCEWRLRSAGRLREHAGRLQLRRLPC